MEAAMPEPAVDVGPSDRVSRLRERIVHAPREACIERARHLTESMSARWDEHPLTRMSEALGHILDNISVIIREDELIVGCRTSKLKGAPFFPENKSRWIEGDVDTFEERVIQKVRIGEAEARELSEDILPFWRGRTTEDRFEELLPADVADDMDKYVFTMVLEITYGVGHFTMNHRRILERGLAGIIADARQKLDAMTPEERSGESGLLYDAMIRSLAATIRFAHRHAAVAEEMAARESDPGGRRSSKRSPGSAGGCPNTRRAASARPSSASTSSTSSPRSSRAETPSRWAASIRPCRRTTKPICGRGGSLRAGARAAVAALSQDQRDLEHPRGGVHPRR